MSNDPLDKEYGILLGIAGPILMDRAKVYRDIAKFVGPGMASMWLLSQADRAEATVKSIANAFNERRV